MLVTLGSLSLPFAYRMAPQAKEVEMLSTESLQRNHQLISKFTPYSCCPLSDVLSEEMILAPLGGTINRGEYYLSHNVNKKIKQRSSSFAPGS
jgi:hypothetical protein